MKNNRIWIAGASLALALTILGACGSRSGEKEYDKAVKAWNKGDLVQARTLFSKATGRLSGSNSKSMAFNKLGLVLWQLDEPEAAAAAFNDACALSETITEARLNLATAQFHTGDLDGAMKSLNMYLGEFPENKTALALKSLVAARKRDWTEASKDLYEAIEKDADNPALHNSLALMEVNGGQDPSRAISRLKKVIAAHPDYAPALYNLGVIHEQWLRDKDSALRYYQGYLQKAGDNGSHVAAARNAIARLKKQGNTPLPTAQTAETHYLRGTQLLKQEKHTEAIREFQKAVQTDSNHKGAYYNMGWASFQLKRYASAQQAFEQALRIDSAYKDARYMLAYALSKQGKWDAAEQQARELAKVDSQRGDVLLKHIATTRP